MRKTFYILLICINLLSLSSCGSSSKDYTSDNISHKEEVAVSTVLQEPDGKRPSYTVMNFLPSTINTELSFSRGPENEIIREYIEFLKDDKIQVKSVSNSSIASSIYEVQNDALVLTYIAEDNYIKKELFNEKPNSNEILLMNPILIGTTWTNNNKQSTITGIDIPVVTEAGTYNSIEVTTNGEEFIQKDYYAVNIGKIKTIFETNGTIFTTELISYKNNTSLQGIYRYYFNSSSGKEFYYLEEKVTELTEKELTEKIANNLYNPPREYLVSLQKNIKINFITLSPEKNYVHIDFSYESKDKFNLEVLSEPTLLKSLSNTLGFNYQVEDILITFDGSSYSPEQLTLEDGVQLKVDYSNYIILQ